MPTWKEDVRDLVQQFPEEFTLAQVYAASGPLLAAHPGNAAPEATIRDVLQTLREGREIEFVNNNGLYRRLNWPGNVRSAPVQQRVPRASRQRTVVGEPDAVPLENRKARAYVVSAVESRTAVAREQQLVDHFKAHLEDQDHVVHRWSIPHGSTGRLYTDLVDATTGTLYEAKASSDRNSVRLAIGQILDYRRFIRPRPRQAAVLLPDRPHQEMVDLLHELQLGCTYRQGQGFRAE